MAFGFYINILIIGQQVEIEDGGEKIRLIGHESVEKLLEFSLRTVLAPYTFISVDYTSFTKLQKISTMLAELSLKVPGVTSGVVHTR